MTTDGSSRSGGAALRAGSGPSSSGLVLGPRRPSTRFGYGQPCHDDEPDNVRHRAAHQQRCDEFGAGLRLLLCPVCRSCRQRAATRDICRSQCKVGRSRAEPHRTPAAVDVVTDVVRRLLAGVPSDGASIETSAALADLRAAIGGELTRRSRGVILGVLAAATLASALTVLGYTLMRRKDFGRRRALGATRLTIVLLIAVQVLLTAAGAATLGALTGNAWLTLHGNPQPPPPPSPSPSLSPSQP